MIPVDYRALLNAADALVSLEDEMRGCDQCLKDKICTDHDTARQKIMTEIRKAIGRPS
jgi:hypothetical protein